MSENTQNAGGGGGRSVLTVVGDFAALMLSPAEPEQDDEDIVEALIAGLHRLVPDADVLRARFAMDADGDLRLRETVDVHQLRALGETEETLFAAVSATDPVSRRGPAGEVASLMVPLVLRGGVIDLVVLQATADRRLSDTDALALSTLRDLAGAAVVGREAQDEARLDALTGCLNHGAMHAQLAREVARVERTGGRLACVMLDLDDFKAVNDRHGHPVGDDLLRAVAASVSAECRPYDSCCRYGGDEFLVILPDGDMTEALGAAERMRAAVARAAVTLDGEEISVTATTGVAARRTGDSAADLISGTDQALLRAKASQRKGDR